MNYCGHSELNYVERIEQSISDMQKLLDAKKLLHDILAKLDSETMTFKFQDEKSYQRMLNKIIPEKRHTINRDIDTLQEKISNYERLRYNENDW